MILALVLAASSVDVLAADVARTVEKAGLAAPIGVYVEGSPAPMSRAVASVVIARLAKLAPVAVQARDATEAEHLAREQHLGSLVRLTVSLESPKLVARGDGLSTWVNFWSGQTPTRSGPAVAIAVSVDADLEALTLAGAHAPVQRPLELNLGVLTKTAGLPAALAVADLDGDARAEVIALVNDALFTWNAEGRLLQRIELSLPLSTRPTREPFGALSVEQGRLVAWSSRRERAELFTWQKDGFRSGGAVEAVQLDGLVVTPRTGLPSFAPVVSWSGKPVTFPEPITQISALGPMALVVSPSGRGWLARGQAPQVGVTHVGTGSALADLDADGSPELIITSTRASGDVDDVRVIALGAFESVAARNANVQEAAMAWQRKIDGRAILAASGDLDGDGNDEVVLGTWRGDESGELLVLRRVAR